MSGRGLIFHQSHQPCLSARARPVDFSCSTAVCTSHDNGLFTDITFKEGFGLDSGNKPRIAKATLPDGKPYSEKDTVMVGFTKECSGAAGLSLSFASLMLVFIVTLF